MNRSTGRAHGRQATSVKVPLPAASPDGEQQHNEFNTEDGVFLVVSEGLAERFRLAFSAPVPVYNGDLFDNVGFVGNTGCPADPTGQIYFPARNGLGNSASTGGSRNNVYEALW